MDASSPSFSSLHHYPCHPTPMSSDSQLINSPNDQLYTQGFNPHDAGDDLLLTRSWEALDKLVSASMVGSSSPSLSDLDQKPLSSFYNSPSSTTASSCLLSEHGSVLNNVGLNLASLFSTKPSFVERAAKFSSFSQQVNPAYNIGNTTSSNAKFSHYNYVGMDNGAASNTSSMNAAQLYATASDSAAMALPTACHVVSKTELDVDDVHLDAQKNDPLSCPQLGSDVVSKKKRAGSSPKDPVEKKEDCKTPSSHHAVKKAKKAQAQSITSISANVESDHAKGISKQEETLTKPDFVHVRARRGQATDSHSLAERVRREKISERMKYLQDLVPGCTKVTGKAMVLDEIINYVQSLQRQVEFLSMKLASVPPSKLEFNFESLFAKQIRAEQHSMAAQNKHSNASFPLDQAAHGMLMKQDAASNYSYLLHDHQYQLPLQPNSTIYPVKPVPSVNGCLLPAEQSIPSAPHCFVSDCSLRRTGNLLATSSSDTLREGISQITDVWDDDLHTIGANRF